ncbi:lysophospholipid acyltransferase family protein [Limibacter armeniacum]|uniref:lysophospholipid acyltransferase family protein n=1 Tax=Limibacter armeniacum TaxID=466084 RepID=UPI002FE5F461
MKKIIKRVYLVWGVFWFLAVFLALLPLFAIIILYPGKKLHHLAYYLNKVWAHCAYLFMGAPVTIERKEKLDKKQPYVFCANHTSFLDTPAVGMVSNRFAVFLGKDALVKAPLFGWMFRNLHIPVYRGQRGNFNYVIESSCAAVDRGHSLGVFPEGTMNRKPPVVKQMKEGGFVIAIKKQIPIVPITLLHNWKLWPSLAPELSWCPVKIVQHEPIETTGLTTKDIPMLKKQVMDTINAELAQYFPEYYQTTLEEEVK